MSIIEKQGFYINGGRIYNGGLRSGFESFLNYSAAVWLQASYLISLSLSFHKDKMEYLTRAVMIKGYNGWGHPTQ